jgi:hypothetical protein
MQNSNMHVITNDVFSPALTPVQPLQGGPLQAPGFRKVRHEGRVYTPDTMVLDPLFWILLHTMYAVSEDADRDFYSLNTQGKQGTMDLRSFAEEVKRRYQCVEHIGGTTKEEVAVVFYQWA